MPADYESLYSRAVADLAGHDDARTRQTTRLLIELIGQRAADTRRPRHGVSEAEVAAKVVALLGWATNESARHDGGHDGHFCRDGCGDRI